MKLNQKLTFWKIRKTDPIVIKTTKVLLIVDFSLVVGLMMTLDIWAKRVADAVYTYKITLRVENLYYVPEILGLVIHGGMILWPILFFFTFTYLFWPLTNDEKRKYAIQEEKEFN